MLPQLPISVTEGFTLAPAGWGGVKVTVLAPSCDDDTVGTICPRLLPTPVFPLMRQDTYGIRCTATLATVRLFGMFTTPADVIVNTAPPQSANRKVPSTHAPGALPYDPHVARVLNVEVVEAVEPDATLLTVRRRGGTALRSCCRCRGDPPWDCCAARGAVQHDFVGAPSQLLHVAAPLDLLPAVGERQGDRAW